MLTADLVRPSSSGGVLRVRALKGPRRARALELADALVAAARASVGRTREELEEALTPAVPAKERKLALGLKKLTLDRCELEESAPLDPAELRRELFELAAARRGALDDGALLDRDAVVADVASARGLTPPEVDTALFADLKGAHRLVRVNAAAGEEIVDRYDLAQAQAILLRAVRVVVRVGGAAPDAYRALFRRLKLLRLLFTLTAEEDGYRLEIDGPLSLFSSATRYGLDLAIALPSLAALPRCDLEAEVRWGKARASRRFVWTRADARLPAPEDERPALREEVRKLLDGLEGHTTPWRAQAAADLLHLPAAGVCVPDLSFVHQKTGEVVHLEVLGYWSREAVWRRVELVEAGLSDRIVFAVSERLRVSERALKADASGALYVYKGVMSPRAVLARVSAVAARG